MTRGGETASPQPNPLAFYFDAWSAQYGEDCVMPREPFVGVLRELEQKHAADAVQQRFRTMLARKPASVASPQMLRKAWSEFGPVPLTVVPPT